MDLLQREELVAMIRASLANGAHSLCVIGDEVGKRIRPEWAYRECPNRRVRDAERVRLGKYAIVLAELRKMDDVEIKGSGEWAQVRLRT